MDSTVSWAQIAMSAIGGVVSALATAGALFAWLLRRIDSVRADSQERIEAVRFENNAAIEKLRNEVIGQLEDFKDEYRDDRRESQKWRESALTTMGQAVTRPEMDRLTRQQTEDLLERLDARVMPLLGREGRR